MTLGQSKNGDQSEQTRILQERQRCRRHHNSSGARTTVPMGRGLQARRTGDAGLRGAHALQARQHPEHPTPRVHRERDEHASSHRRVVGAMNLRGFITSLSALGASSLLPAATPARAAAKTISFAAPPTYPPERLKDARITTQLHETLEELRKTGIHVDSRYAERLRQ